VSGTDITILYRPDPFAAERECRAVPYVQGRTVGEYVREEMARRNPVASPSLQWAIGLSGAEVSEQADAIVPSPGETIRVCPYVEDFSGGFGRTVAMLAVVAAGVWTAGAVNSLLMTQGVLHMNSAMFAAGSAGWAGAIAAGGVVIAGGLAVNALMPPASPDTGGFDEGEPSETSPSYAYNPAANPAMNGGCVPVV
jgi:hypothetical protein